MKLIAKFCGILAMLPFLTDAARAERSFFYGASCERENLTAARVPDGLDGIVLEGRSGAEMESDIPCADRPALFLALSRALRGKIGNQHGWSGTQRSSRGLVRIAWDFRDHGVRCRDFALDHTIAGKRHLRQGTACLEPDGYWHLH